jgi:hypothetical protein
MANRLELHHTYKYGNDHNVAARQAQLRQFEYMQDRMDDQLQAEFQILECRFDDHTWLLAYGNCIDNTAAA